MFGCIYVSDFPVQAALRYEAGIYLAESVASRKALPAESAGKDLSAEESVINASLTKPSSPKTSKISPTVASLDKVSFDQNSLIQKFFDNHQIAVLDGPANQMKVFACNGPARKAGIEICLTMSLLRMRRCWSVREGFHLGWNQRVRGR